MPRSPAHAALPFAEALAQVLAHCAPLPGEAVPFDRMVGRVLVDDARAAQAEPPHAKSAMDGFAVRAAETSAATTAAPVTFDWRAVIGAGPAATAAVPPGQAVRIMTGALLPPGVDAVVKLEDTRAAGDARFALTKPLAPGENVIPAGSILRAGQPLVPARRGVAEQALTLLAGQGPAAWQAHRQPRVGLLALGDELVAPGQPLVAGQLYASNLYGIEALCRRYGAEPVRLGLAGDDPDLIEARLRSALQSTPDTAPCDVLLTLGGSHQGDFDYAGVVFERLGGHMRFRRTRINLGGSTLFATLTHPAGAALCFGLPGTPMAAWLAFELLVRPALWRLAGRQALDHPQAQALLQAPYSAPPGRTFFVPARVTCAPDAPLQVTPLVRGTPLALPASVLANGLIRWPQDIPHLPAGSPVTVDLLDIPASAD